MRQFAGILAAAKAIVGSLRGSARHTGLRPITMTKNRSSSVASYVNPALIAHPGNPGVSLSNHWQGRHCAQLSGFGYHGIEMVQNLGDGHGVDLTAGVVAFLDNCFR